MSSTNSIWACDVKMLDLIPYWLGLGILYIYIENYVTCHCKISPVFFRTGAPKKIIEQAGFRKRCSIAEQILNLKLLNEKYWNDQKPTRDEDGNQQGRSSKFRWGSSDTSQIPWSNYNRWCKILSRNKVQDCCSYMVTGKAEFHLERYEHLLAIVKRKWRDQKEGDLG